MTELLNLDDLPTAAPARSIKIKGKSHHMANLSVGAFIEERKSARDLKDKGQDEQVVHTLLMVKMLFPTIPEDVLKGLSFDQLAAIMTFITKQSDDVVDEAASAEKNA